MSQYLQYNDPLKIIWRKGTVDNPYVDKTDNLKIINNQIVLSEIPDEFNHVEISGYTEIYKGKPLSTEFLVNYQNGIVAFNSTEEGKTVTVSYKGRGQILYPAERIYLHNENPDIVETLQEIVDNGQDAINAVGGLQGKIDEASTLEVDLEADIATGNTLHNDLQNDISTGNTLKTDLDTCITDGTTLKNDLNSASSNANATKSDLDTGITNGQNLKTDLDNTITLADTKKTNLDNAVSTANTVKTDLDGSITTAQTTKSDLDNSIVTGTTLKSDLDTSIITAENTKADLDTAIINGDLTNKADLDGSGKVPVSQVPTLDYIPLSDKGTANGVAILDSNGLIPAVQLPTNVKEIQVVNTIGDRDALTPYEGMRVHVLDASADNTVQSGWAEYLYSGSVWVKTAEKESIDVVLDWSNIQSKPDLFVPASHKSTHTTGGSDELTPADIGAAPQSQLDEHLADYTLQIPYGGTTTNVGNAYSIATPAISALTAGMAIAVKINADSTDASTLNWNSKGAKAIKKANGTDITNLKANGIYTLRYDGTNFILQGEGASGNATASDLLLGKTATTDAGEIVGTMTSLPVKSINIVTQSTEPNTSLDQELLWVDTESLGSSISPGNYYFSHTEPASPIINDVWINTSDIVVATNVSEVFPYVDRVDSIVYSDISGSAISSLGKRGKLFTQGLIDIFSSAHYTSYWDGSSWVRLELHYWDCSKWLTLSPRYLYELGTELVPWEDGISLIGGSKSKQATYFQLKGSSTDGPSDQSFVISTPIDLTNYSKLYVESEHSAPGGAVGTYNAAIASASKLDGYKVYSARYYQQYDYDRRVNSVDISGVTGDNYIRVHAGLDYEGGGWWAGTGYYYKIWLIKYE